MSEIEAYMPLIKELNVSKRARSPNQFLSVYKQHGVQLPDNWALKRENFIKRHYVQYMNNPTIRRRLALIAWAFDPENK